MSTSKNLQTSRFPMPSLTLATINLCNLGTWSAPEKIGHFIHAIQNRLDFPDIIAVQEIGGVSSQSDLPVEATIAQIICDRLNSDLTNRYHYIDCPPLPNSSGGATDFNIRCGFFYRDSVIIDQHFLIGQDNSAFIGNEAIGYAPSRLPLALKVCFNDRALWIINCHLKSMNKNGQTKQTIKKQRNFQAKAITELIANKLISQNTPILIVGDFNDTPGSRTLKTVEESGFKAAHLQLKEGIYSYKHHNKPILLDYIMYNNGVQLENTEILHINTDLTSEYRFSDHDPILTTIVL